MQSGAGHRGDEGAEGRRRQRPDLDLDRDAVAVDARPRPGLAGVVLGSA